MPSERSEISKLVEELDLGKFTQIVAYSYTLGDAGEDLRRAAMKAQDAVLELKAEAFIPAPRKKRYIVTAQISADVSQTEHKRAGQMALSLGFKKTGSGFRLRSKKRSVVEVTAKRLEATGFFDTSDIKKKYV